MKPSFFASATLVFFGITLAAEASQFAECMIGSFDACPRAASWSCTRYRIYGRDFETEGWFAYPLFTGKRRQAVEDELEKLVREGVCPGKRGNQPPTSIDPKYVEAKEKSEERLGRKMKRFLKRF